MRIHGGGSLETCLFFAGLSPPPLPCFSATSGPAHMHPGAKLTPLAQVEQGTPGGVGPWVGGGGTPSQNIRNSRPVTYVLDSSYVLRYRTYMPCKNITLSIDTVVLDAFDTWRAGRPRGEAIAALLAYATSSSKASPGAVPVELGTARAAEPDIGPSVRDLKLTYGKAVLKEVSKYVGVPTVEVEGDDVRKQEPDEETLRNRDTFLAEKPAYVSTPISERRDPYSQVEEYPGAEDAVDDPSPDVQDQRRKGRRG